MLELKQSNVGVSLLCIHRVITRGLNVTAEMSRAFAEDGFPNARAREGFACYAHSLTEILNAHHLTEDELVFPYFRALIPDAPYADLAANHQAMTLILAEARAAVKEIESNEECGPALGKLHQSVSEIADIRGPHIAKEEQYFNVADLTMLIEPEEHARLNNIYMEHSQQNAQPDYLVVPFMLYNLNDEDRKVFENEMPPVVTEQLVPVVWKEKWAPMVQFLLPQAEPDEDSD
jgi:hypothetical protein